MEQDERNKILEYSRKKKVDEREEFIIRRSYEWSYVAVCLLVVVLMVVRLIRGEMVQDLVAVVDVALFSAMLYRSVKLHRRAYIVGAVFAGIALVASIAAYILWLYGV